MENRVHSFTKSATAGGRILAAWIVIVTMIGPGLALASKKKPPKPPPPPVSALPEHVSYLAWQLRGKHMDETGEITGAIEKAVLDHLQAWFAEDPSRAESVTARRELERIFFNLKYPTEAKPSCFDQPWKGSTLVGVGYTLYWTNYNRSNVLAIFEKSAGKVRLAAVTHFLPMVDLRYEFHPAVGSDDFWFFAWGERPGKSQQRLSSVLYAFNGQELKSLWETHDAYDGRLIVGEKKVAVRYLREDEYIREQSHGRKPPRHEATYLITSKGLELESDRDIPF
jgi:hypothetical protein